METLTYPNAGSLPVLFSDRCLILKVGFRKEERKTIAIFVKQQQKESSQMWWHMPIISAVRRQRR